jgi:cytochrome c556
MQKLVAATRTGNLENVKASFNATSGSCKTCHDAYREK